MMTFSLSTSFFIKASFKDFGSSMFNDDEFLTILVEIGFLFATFSRFCMGEKREYKSSLGSGANV